MWNGLPGWTVSVSVEFSSTSIGRRHRKRLFAAFRYAVLSIWLAVVVFPLFWIVATSFKRPGEWITWPPVWWPTDPTLFNYIRVWVSDTIFGPADLTLATALGPWEALINTFIIAFTASSLATIFAAVIAYGASRYRILSDTQLMYTRLIHQPPCRILFCM